MAEIESRDEDIACIEAYDRWLPTYDGRYLGNAFEAGGIASRDWHRARDEREIAAATERMRRAIEQRNP